jgi:hypothetical protein
VATLLPFCVHGPAFCRAKTPGAFSKPRMSVSVKIYENTLWLETYLFWSELQVI